MAKQKLVYLLLFPLMIITVLIWYAVFYLENHQGLTLDFFDVGQGDAIFIQTPNFNQVLIDGGPNDAVLSGLAQSMSFWDRSIDLLVLTHPHADHLDGLLGVLKRYKIDMVLETGVNHSIPEYEEWRNLLREKKVKVVIAKIGQRVRLSDTAYLDILAPLENFAGMSPKNLHEAVIVSRLVYASTSVLLMGDAEKALEYQLASSGVNLKSSILKVGHHGSKTSTSEEFLRAVSPRLAVISAGRKNRYGHPYQEVLDRLARAGIKILRTDLDNNVELVSDGFKFGLSK